MLNFIDTFEILVFQLFKRMIKYIIKILME